MSIGFKEWALVCEELGSGRQSIILRKGGIAEGRAGFRFQHDDFLLLPTLFHEQVSKLKLPSDTALPLIAEATHTISHRIVVEWTQDLTDWEQIVRLNPFHIWREHVIRERFEYDAAQGISLAFVRVHKLHTPAVFPDSPKYGGCRSWVTLPDMDEMQLSSPVLDDKKHREAEAAIQTALMQKSGPIN
jgi:hypothetical protein